DRLTGRGHGPRRGVGCVPRPPGRPAGRRPEGRPAAAVQAVRAARPGPPAPARGHGPGEVHRPAGRTWRRLCRAAPPPPPPPGPAPPPPGGLPPRARKPWKKLRKEVRKAGDDPPDEELHQIRI